MKDFRYDDSDTNISWTKKQMSWLWDKCIYTANNDKIRQLKEKKLNSQVSKWWLYFGKVDS